MDLESPLRTIASPVEAEALRVLAGADTQFTAPQIHRLAESASPYGIRKALTRLADSGLVHSSSHGSSTLWRGNREHVLWPAVDVAVRARNELVGRMQAQFAERSELSAYFYGSFARRSTTPESDIDVLVVYPDDAEHDDIVDFAYGLTQSIRAWTGNDGHVFNATRSWLRDSIARADPVTTSIRREAVTLVGPDFDQLLRTNDADGAEHA